MEKFATAFAVPVTEEQYRQIAPKLIALGYIDRDNWGDASEFLVNDYMGDLGTFGTAVNRNNDWMENRLILNEFNEDLVLALAAMTSDPRKSIKGEWIWVEANKKLLQDDGIDPESVLVYPKPTAQELIDHFTKPQDPFLKFVQDNSKKLQQGWTLELVPPAKFDMGNGVVISKNNITIDDSPYAIHCIKTVSSTLSKRPFGIDLFAQLGDHNRKFSWQDLENIINKHDEIYGTPGVAPEPASESIH